MGDCLFTLKKTVKRNAVITGIVRFFFDAVRNRLKRKTALFICKNYKHLFEKYDNLTPPAAETAANYPVWTCWFQGKENMPEIIKMCYRTLLRNAGGHTVNLITSDNYMDFVDIPEYIREKHKKNIISHTHYSDILRIHLLCKYGGLWLDATTFISSELPSFDGFSYWTGRWNGGYRRARATLSTDFLSYCLPNDILWSFLKEFYLDYWKKYNKLISYYTLEVAMRCAYENIKSVKAATDKVPITRQGMLDLYSMLNSEYNPEKYKALCEEVCFHKLTHKEDFRKYTKDGKPTFYGYLCRQYEQWRDAE